MAPRPERGGPTTQAGIYFQNCITVLRMAEMLSQSQLPPILGNSIDAVRAEAPAEVDDTVVSWSGGRTEYIQAKLSLTPRSEAWDGLWRHFYSQYQQPDFDCGPDKDVLVLAVSYATNMADLDAATVKAQTAKSVSEWRQRLTNSQNDLVDSIRTLLNLDPEPLFGFMRSVRVWILSFEGDPLGTDTFEREVQRKLQGVVEPAASVFAHLIDLVGRTARVRGAWTYEGLVDYLRARQFSFPAHSTSSQTASGEPPTLYVNVPPMPNHLLGRDDLVADLVKRLTAGEHAALSLDGSPGVGKTTLAVALAHHREVLAHFTDGVLWAGLGQQPDVMSALAAWAQALGLDPSSLPDLAGRRQAVQNAIGQRRMLLVLDDAWQLEPAQQLRLGGPNCCHLLTTRDEALARRFAGNDQARKVSVLADDAAYELLKTLAPDAYAADPEAARTLASMVGALPLALELLGGYLAAPENSYFPDLGAAALAELTDPHRRLALATQRLGNGPDRAVTLQETISFSLNVLPELAVKTFNALGAFAALPTTFDRAAAEAVTGGDAKVLALLIARNLIERRGAEQQTLALHQTVADVARTAMEPATRNRHLSYYLAQVNRDRDDWRRIESVYGQIKWAWHNAEDDKPLLEMVYALNTYQIRSGLWDDAQTWIERALRLAEAKGWKSDCGTLLNDLGRLYDGLGRWDEAIQQYQSAITYFKASGNRQGEAQALGNIGNVRLLQGRWQEAEQLYEASLGSFRDLKDLEGEASALSNLGLVYAQQGRWEEAIQKHEAGLDISRRVGDRAGEAQALGSLGNAYVNLGNLTVAKQAYQGSLAISQQLGDRQAEAQVLTNLGILYTSQGRWEEASKDLESSLAIARELGDRHSEGVVLINLASLYRVQNRQEEASQQVQASRAIFSQLGDQPSEAKSLILLGHIYADQERWADATQQYEASLAISRDIGDRHGEGVAFLGLGFLYERQGQTMRAGAFMLKALARLNPGSPEYGQAIGWSSTHDPTEDDVVGDFKSRLFRNRTVS